MKPRMRVVQRAGQCDATVEVEQDRRVVMLVAMFVIVVITVLFANLANTTAQSLGLVSWWAGEGNADDTVDGNDGTLVNGATFATGKVGRAFSFDGVDDYVDVPNSANLNPANHITVMAWYRPESSFSGNGFNAIVDKGYSSHSYPFYQYHLGVTGDRYPNNPRTFGFWITAGGRAYPVAFQPNSWTFGAWYHLVGTYDGSTVKLYVDGVLSASTPASGTMVDYGQNVRIGAFTNLSRTGVDYTPGTIDEVAIYNCALNAREIQAGIRTCPDRTPPTVQCRASVNPGGANPGSTNEDGFFQVSASDQVTASPHMTLGTFVLANGETVKLTQRPGVPGVTLVGMMKPGPNGIKHFLVGPGDAVISARDEAGNVATATCLVPPPPK